jgi:transposase InsO family protein
LKAYANAHAERWVGTVRRECLDRMLIVGRLRDECLNEHWFTSLADARRTVEAWRRDYNAVRHHSGLGYRTPDEVRRTPISPATTLATPIGLTQ